MSQNVIGVPEMCLKVILLKLKKVEQKPSSASISFDLFPILIYEYKIFLLIFNLYL